MRNAAMALLGLIGLAACEPAPTYTAGVGFDDYSSLEAGRAEREAELRGGSSSTLPLPPASGGAGPISSAELAAAGLPTAGAAPLAGTPLPSGVPVTGQGLTTTPGQGLAPAAPRTGAISDEQNFDAVSSRETIQSDAERLAAQRQAYQVIEPTPLPPRPTSTEPNIVAYALQTTNRIGERIYTRSGVSLAITGRGCGSYPSPDKAQEAFLASGGPRRDPRGLDPDGDGFACSWDPAPFRAARSN